MRIVIVGSGAAGATAAQYARKTNRTAEVVLVAREPYGEYSRCGLPYVLSGIIDTVDNLIEYPPEWFRRFGVSIRPSTEVASVDVSRHSVTTVSLLDGKKEVVGFDSLVLATGSKPRLPPISDTTSPDGSPINRVFTLRTIDDTRTIGRALTTAESCLIIGAGPIGMEVCEALSTDTCHRGRRIWLLDLEPHALATMIDFDMAEAFERAIAARGIDFLASTSVTHLKSDDKCHVEYRCSTGEVGNCAVDIVIVSVGSAPDSALGESAGCLSGPSGGLVVDDHCRTSVDGVYAAGDCTAYCDFITGRPLPVGLGSVAVRQGRVAGINAAGGNACQAEGLLNSRTTRLFGLTVAAVGPTSAALRRSGIEPVVGKVTTSTLPRYFPGGKNITVKVLAHPLDARLLGAQIVGEEGVHLRTDVMAAAVLSSMTTSRFLQLETCYAPPVSPTLDCLTLATEVPMCGGRETRR